MKTNPDVVSVNSWVTSHHRRVGHVLQLIQEGERNDLTIVEWMKPNELRKLAEDILEGRYPGVKNQWTELQK